MSDVLLKSLSDFYNDVNNRGKLLDVINNTNNISLRIIDWFVTNYSKKFNIKYFINNVNGINFMDLGENSKQFNIYYSYKTQLKSYSKKKFDPFCRRNRIEFTLNNNDKIITTVGQLNFFKWAINNCIIDYIFIHYKEIEEDMNISLTNINKKKDTEIRKKRQELSKSASRGLNTNNIKVTIDFN